MHAGLTHCFGAMSYQESHGVQTILVEKHSAKAATLRIDAKRFVPCN